MSVKSALKASAWKKETEVLSMSVLWLIVQASGSVSVLLIPSMQLILVVTILSSL